MKAREQILSEAGTTFAAPVGHEVADSLVDCPHPPREGHSENLVFFGFDPRSGWSYWSHVGRLAPDPSIWEAIVVVTTPDGDLLGHRSVGRSVLEPASAEARFECLAPGQRWRIRLGGVVQRTRLADTRRRPVSPMHLPGSTKVIDPYEHLRIELEFIGTYPMCNTKVSSDQGWGDLHLHQLGRTVGRIEAENLAVEVDFNSMRDHTRGPRDYSALRGQWWATCIFPSGRAFDILQTWTTTGAVWSKGFVWDSSTAIISADMTRVDAHNADGAPTDFRIRLTDQAGVGTIEGTALAVFNNTLIRPTGLALGHHAVDGASLIMIESPARFTWGGETGYGWIERCGAISDLRAED